MRKAEPPALRDQVLLAGLRELSASAFPKRCATCGRTYDSVQDYVARTAAAGRSTSGDPQSATGLKQAVGDDGATIVELFRNCECGSTLIDFFADRRDASPQAVARRARFSELLDYLEQRGLERLHARDELLKVMRGIPSPLLRGIAPPAAFD